MSCSEPTYQNHSAPITGDSSPYASNFHPSSVLMAFIWAIGKTSTGVLERIVIDNDPAVSSGGSFFCIPSNDYCSTPEALLGPMDGETCYEPTSLCNQANYRLLPGRC